MRNTIFETGTTRGRVPIPMNMPRGPVGAGIRSRIAYSVLRIPYCVTTGRNTQYGIHTMADSPNRGFANL